MSQPKLQTEFETSDVSPGFLLWQVNNRWQSKQRKALQSHGLTHVQFVLLASLVWSPSQKSLTQKQLADYAKTDIMMTSQVLRKLEQKGLITRTVGIADARSMTLSATQDGVKLTNEAIATVEAVDKEFFKSLGNDAQEFTRMMQRLSS